MPTLKRPSDRQVMPTLASAGRIPAAAATLKSLRLSSMPSVDGPLHVVVAQGPDVLYKGARSRSEMPARGSISASSDAIWFDLDDAVPVRDFKMTVYDGEPSR